MAPLSAAADGRPGNTKINSCLSVASSPGTFPVFGPVTYTISTGPITDVFSVTRSAAAYQARLVNFGNAQATVTLNGQQIFGPHDFNRPAAVVTRPVSLLNNNRLTVEIASDPGSRFSLEFLGIDRDAPVITATVSPQPNSAGWNNTSTTVKFLCSDGADLVTCPAPITVTADGANQVISGQASDQAGNTARASARISLDRTPPKVSATITPAPNPAGWNNTAATVTFTCSDELSGIQSCPPPVAVVREGSSLIAGTTTDRAGNSSTNRLTVLVDQTPPSVQYSITPAPNIRGWNNGAVTVSYTCADEASGVSQCPAPVRVTAEGTQTLAGTARDQAGNSATVSARISIDSTPPDIAVIVAPPPNPEGWNNSDVTVTFGCSDSGSGIDSCDSPVTVSGQTADRAISGAAWDRAGNSNQASLAIHIDEFPPAVTIGSPADGSVLSTGTVTVSGTATDDLSGIAAVTCQGKPAIVAGPTFTCTVTLAAGPNSIAVQATDRAGNSQQTVIGVQGVAPNIMSASPSSAQQGQTSLAVTVAGQFTHFAPGVTTADFGDGVTVTALTVPSATAATATVNIDAGAAPGPRTVTLTTNGEQASLAGGVTVVPGTPTAVAITPSAAQPGQANVRVTILGQYTHFLAGVTTVDFGLGTSVASLAVNSPTSLTAGVNVDWATPTGARNVTVKTNSETVTGGFAVQSRASGLTGGLSVLDFAKCDGITDDTTALQAGINAAAAQNQALRVVASAPCVSGPLSLPAGAILVGPGTIERKAGTGTQPLLTASGDGVTISGVTFDGNSAGQSGSNLILARNAAQLFFENNTVLHTVSGEYAVRLIAITNSRIEGNHLSGIAGPGIAVADGSSYVLVDGNGIDHTAATSGRIGLSAYTAQIGSTNGIHDVIFSNNTAVEKVHFCFEAGNFLSGSKDVSKVYNIQFTGNSCTIANTTGINDCSADQLPAACGGYSFATMSNSSITQNTYNAAGQVVGIAAIEMAGCSACNATGNTLIGDTSTVFHQGSEGITANCRQCVISDNRITNWSPTNFTAGIEIHTISDLAFQSVDDNLVTGNRVVMPGGSNSVKGIYVNCNNHGAAAPSASRSNIAGNAVVGAGPGNGQAIAVAQNDAACTLDGTVVSNNTLSNATEGIQVYGGTNYTIQNNQISGVSTPVMLMGGATLASPVVP